MHPSDDYGDSARHRVLRTIALAAGLAGFALSFPVFNAMLPDLLLWLTGNPPGAPVPLYGARALTRVAIAAALALSVGAGIFASLARGVIYRSQCLASPAPENPVSAAVAGALLGLGVYAVMAAAMPAIAPFSRWPGREDLVVFILVPAAFFFFSRILGLAAEGAAQRRVQGRRRGGGSSPGRTLSRRNLER